MKYKDSKIQTDIMILDFSKVFDNVPHDKLLYKRRHYETIGGLLDWISVFYNNENREWYMPGLYPARRAGDVYHYLCF